MPGTRGILEEGLKTGLFTGAALAIIAPGNEVDTTYLGKSGAEPGNPAVGPDSRFDLASMTKVLATTILAMKAREAGALDLEAPLGRYLEGAAASGVSIRDLLRHTGGLPAVPALERTFPDPRVVDPTRARHVLLALAPDEEAGRRVIYSCTGFLLLGLALEAIGGATLATLFSREVAAPLGLGATGYWPVPPEQAVATEYCAWRGRRIQGEVHDESAWCLGPTGAGNAGLFSTLPEVVRLASVFLPGGPPLLSEASVGLMTKLQTRGLSEARGLGFLLHGAETQDGPDWPEGSFGHTGFTGTSLFIEPGRGLGVVLLTNRVYPGRALTQERMPPFRKALHGAVLREFDARRRGA